MLGLFNALHGYLRHCFFLSSFSVHLLLAPATLLPEADAVLNQLTLIFLNKHPRKKEFSKLWVTCNESKLHVVFLGSCQTSEIIEIIGVVWKVPDPFFSLQWILVFMITIIIKLLVSRASLELETAEGKRGNLTSSGLWRFCYIFWTNASQIITSFHDFQKSIRVAFDSFYHCSHCFYERINLEEVLTPLFWKCCLVYCF